MSERDPYREAGYNEEVFWGYVDGKRMPFVSQKEYEEYLKERAEDKNEKKQEDEN